MREFARPGYGVLQNSSEKNTLSAHVVNRLLRENRKTIPKILSGKKLFKNVTPPDFKFYPSKLTDKIFSIWCNVKFSLLFYIV